MLGLFAVSYTSLHFNWLFHINPLLSADWPYFSTKLLQSWYPYHKIWIDYDGLGRPIVQGNFILLFTAYSFLAKLGLNFELISRFIFFYPVFFLTPVTSYLLARKISNDKIAALACTFIYSLNSYIVVIQGGHMHLAVAYALAPLAFYLSLHKDRFLQLTLVLCLISFFEVRELLLILTVCFSLSFIEVKPLLSTAKLFIANWVIAILAIMGVNAFWIIPKLNGGAGLIAVKTFEQQALNWVTTANALTLHHPFWSASGVSDFVFFAPEAYLYIIPILAFLSFFYHEPIKRKYVNLFACSSVLSVFFLTQNNGPFATLFNYIYTNINLFSAYRESSKFFMIAALSYGVLVTLLISELRRRRGPILANACLLMLLLILLIPLRNHIFSNYDKTYKNNSISAESQLLNEYIASSSPHRTLWLSKTPKYAYQAANYDNLDGLTLGQGTWGLFDSTKKNPFQYLMSHNAQAVLDFSSIKSVVIPSNTIGGGFKNFSNTSSAYFDNIVRNNLNLTNRSIHNIKSKIWDNPTAKDRLYISENTVLSDSNVDTFSGRMLSKRSAYIFSDQLTVAQLTRAKTFADNTEINLFKNENVRVESGIVKGDGGSLYDARKSYIYLSDFQNTTLKHISARLENRVIKIISSDVWQTDNSEELYSFTPDLNDKFAAISINSTVLNIDFNNLLKQKSILLGTSVVNNSNNEIILYQPIKLEKPLLSNGSFEFGTWNNISDCNNFDHTSLESNGINAEISTDASSGANSLRLRANSHLACTVKTFKSYNGTDLYSLTAKYKNLKGNPPYFTVFTSDDENNKVNTFYGNTADKNWNEIQGFFKPSTVNSEIYKSANNSLFLYTGSNLNKLSENFIDDINITPYKVVNKTVYNQKTTAVIGTYNERTFNPTSDKELKSTDVSGDNLYSNGSFEKTDDLLPGDCNNSDNTTLKHNGISASKSNDSTVGEKSLKLTVKSHTACFSNNINNFNKNYDYIINFDYKTDSANKLEYSIYPRAGIPHNIREPLSNPRHNSWVHYKKLIKSDDFSDQMNLIFYLPGDGKSTRKAFIDNVVVQKVPRLPYVYIYSKNTNNNTKSTITDIHNNEANSTATFHHFDKPEMLVFSDSYNTRWRVIVYKPDGSKVYTSSAGNHYPINGFANGWYLNPKDFESQNTEGNYLLRVEYVPQNYFEAGVGISIISLAICCAYFIIVRKADTYTTYKR